MSVTIDKFLKNYLANNENLSSAGIFLNDVNWGRFELQQSSFEYRFTHFRIL